jgi:glycosyltransferase
MKTTIVIPNYNGAHFLEKCMPALLSQSRQDFSILFVDNASKDDSEKQIRYWMEQDPERIFLIQNTENTGFATAVNQGILWAKEHGSSYALLLNNDTEVAPDFVEKLLLFMEEKEKKGEKVFALSSKMVKMHDPSLMDDAGDELCLLGFPFQRGLEDEASRWTKAEKVFSACGGASLYSIPLLEETGLFDEKHFAYLEDVDLSFRAQWKGYSVYYCPTALCKHVGSGTSGGKYSDFKVELSARNSIFLLYKNFPLGLKILNFLPFLLGILIKALYFQKKGYGKAYQKGIFKGLKERKEMKKVDFRGVPLGRMLAIELRLFKNCFVYLSERKRRRKGLRSDAE